jgi:hypothetical protein
MWPFGHSLQHSLENARTVDSDIEHKHNRQQAAALEREMIPNLELHTLIRPAAALDGFCSAAL